MAKASDGILIAATPLDPPVDGKVWAFHVVNASPDPVTSGVLDTVEYEWGDMGRGSDPKLAIGAIPAGGSLEIWRDDDSAAELRMSLVLRLLGPWGERKLTAEFGKLYKVKDPGPVPVLGRPGVLGHLLIWPRPPGTVEIDGTGVRRWLAEGKLEAVRWDALAKVEIMTTDDGPRKEDVFWILDGGDGSGCVIPSDADPAGAILARVQKLKGVDNEAVIKAMASTDKARFLIWELPKPK